jgi:hypothetical protein
MSKIIIVADFKKKYFIDYYANDICSNIKLKSEMSNTDKEPSQYVDISYNNI